MANEEVRSGYFRTKSGDKWIRHAFWTKASQVYCDDGSNVEEKISNEISTQLASLRASFAGALSRIAEAISAQGTPVPSDAKPDQIVAGIGTMADNKYNAGVAAADGRPNPNSYNYQAGYNAKTVRFVKLGDCNINPLSSGKKANIPVGNQEYTFDLSAYARYGINTNNIILRNQHVYYHSKTEVANQASIGASYSIVGNTLIVYCPRYQYRDVWYDSQSNEIQRHTEYYTTCEVWLCFGA